MSILINGLLVDDGGDSENRWSVPGGADHSMILKRLSGIGAVRMPPLVTGERDLAAEKLIPGLDHDNISGAARTARRPPAT